MIIKKQFLRIMAVYGKRFRMEIIDEIMEYPLAESFK